MCSMFRQIITEQTQFAGTLMPREIGPWVGTLDDPDEDNGPLIYPVIIKNVSDDLTGTMKLEWQPHPYPAQI